jgi:hypothetical protein
MLEFIHVNPHRLLLLPLTNLDEPLHKEYMNNPCQQDLYFIFHIVTAKLKDQTPACQQNMTGKSLSCQKKMTIRP